MEAVDFNAEALVNRLFPIQSEMDWLKENEPVIYGFLKENGYEAYWNEQEDTIFVRGNDDEDFDIPFRLFAAILKNTEDE